MKELFEILNQTDGERIFGYFLITIITIVVTINGIAKIIWSCRKEKIKKVKDEI